MLQRKKKHIKIGWHSATQNIVINVPFMLTIPKKKPNNINSYSGMILAQGFLSDGQSIVKQMGSLFVFILVPTFVKDTHVR